MAKTASDVLTDSKRLPVRLHGWREVFASVASYSKLAGYLVVFVSVLVADELWNLVWGRDKHCFDKFDELQ